MFKKRQFLNNKMCEHLTGLLQGVSRSTSGAIHPSVPGIPDRKEKLVRPSGIFLQSPKSEMRARTRPSALGPDRRMFLGFRSRWTKWRDDGERRRHFFRKMGKRRRREESNFFFSVQCLAVMNCLIPILSEWRCESPHIVCSSRLTGFSSGKQDGSSTYCREYRKTSASLAPSRMGH